MRTLNALILALSLTLPLSLACEEEEEAPAPSSARVLRLGPSHFKPRIEAPEALGWGHYQVGLGLGHLSSWRAAGEDLMLSASGLARSTGLELEAWGGLWPALDLGFSMGLSELYADQAYTDESGVQAGPQMGGGLGDTWLKARWQALDRPEQGLGLAWVLGVSIPTGRPGKGAYYLGAGRGATQLDNSLVLALDQDQLTWQAELGYCLPLSANRGTELGELRALAGLGWQADSSLQPYADLAWERAFEEQGSGRDLLDLGLGLVWEPLPGYRGALGVRQALLARNAGHGAGLDLKLQASF